MLTCSSDNVYTEPGELDTVEICEITVTLPKNVEGRSGDNKGLRDFEDKYTIHEQLVSCRVCWKR